MIRARPRVSAGLPAVVSALAIVVLLAGGCGVTTPSPLPSASTGPTGSAHGSGGPDPRSTPWLGNADNAIEAMGLADGEIRQAMSDFNAGVQGNDPAQMLQAANGLATVDVMLPNADRIEAYPPMRDLAGRYRTAITQMSTAAKALRTALEAGDGPGVTSSSRDLVESFTLYADLQAELADFVVQLPEQKRLLLQ